jgi:hypothetical protein
MSAAKMQTIVGPHQNARGDCWWCGGKMFEEFHGAFESVRTTCRCCNGTNVAAKGFNEFLGITPRSTLIESNQGE